MIFIETKLPGAYIIEIEPIRDERGFFARAWCQREFRGKGLITTMAQSNLSLSGKKGTLRGMHYQVAPYEEVKLLKCIRGGIYDVIIDLRPDSPTFEQWMGVELSAENRKMLYVPQGFAHGFQTLRDDTEVFYQVSEFYHPAAERGIRWNDPAFGIQWAETEVTVMSEKDQNWPDYARSRESFVPVEQVSAQ